MDTISVKVKGTLKGNFDEIVKELPKAETHALYKAAYFLRDRIRQKLASSLPASTKRSPKYNDTLIDAIGFTKVDGASLVVNALGTGKKGSGQYRTRFFEEGTVDRYQKKRNGVRLKKKHFLGHIKPLKFFHSTVDANEAAVVSIMQAEITKYVDMCINK